MKFILGLFLASALVGSAWGQAPSVVFPSTPAPPPAPIGQATQLQSDQLYVVQSTNPIVIVASPQGVVKITPDVGPLRIRGHFVDSNKMVETRTFKGPHIYIVEASGSGTCELIVAPTMDQKDVIRRTLTTDITPAPGPTPGPGPTPSPAPIPVDGFRSLIVYESADLSKIPASQLNALYSQQVRDYLTAHCVAGPDGKTKEWRCWDKDTDLTNESKLWQDAMKRPRKEIPWIILSDGKKGFEGPLPKTEADLLSLLKQYGG